MKKLLLSFGALIFFSESYCDVEISFINSDSAEYKNDTVSCKGNVVIVYDKKIISADEIFYDKKNDIIKAKGNVIVKDELQNVFLADFFLIEKNFKFGKVENLKIITQDKTRLAAKFCEIKNEEYILENVIFSPCYECTESEKLTWQLKSEKVIFNPKNYTAYHNAIFESFDVPILYVPYLSHVSANIKRKSGFLIPKFSISSQQGFSFLPQYLFSISDSQELILKPIITTKIGQVAWLYYGLRFPNGEFNIDTSITGTKSVDKKNINEKTDKIKRSGYRGHIFSKFRYEINDIWRTGFDINLASDRYYLKRFSFFNDPNRTLESSIYLEGFDQRNYTKIKSSMFQSEYMESTPRLLPIIEHSHFFEFLNGTLAFNSVFMNLDFKQGRNSQKFIVNPSWSKEILFPGGHIFDFNTIMSMQGLKVSEIDKSDYDSYFEIMPQINLIWKWPLVVNSDFMNSIFTPIAGISIAGNKKNFDAFEDPFDEINESNLFSNNHSISPYNVDRGKRYFFGMQVDGYYDCKNIYHLILGQSVELTEPEKRLESSGMKYKHSNLIGGLDIFLNDSVTLFSNASYARRTNRFDKIEWGINFSEEKLSFGVMGFKGQQNFYNPFAIIQENVNEKNSEKKYKGIKFDFNYKWNKRLQLNYEIIFGNRYDPINLRDKEDTGKLKMLKNAVGVNFENECAKISFICERNNKRGGDLRPETNFKFVVHLKKLG